MPGSRAAVLLACCAAAIQTVGLLGSTAGRAEAAVRGSFDLQAHRGGLGLVTESTLEAFANALELGVTSLELDVRLTEDGHPVVTHDRRVSAIKCRDTAPASAGDPEFPYVGDLVRRLSVAQVSTLDCGWQQLPGFPLQRVVAGARMPLLSEVFDLHRLLRRGAGPGRDRPEVRGRRRHARPRRAGSSSAWSRARSATRACSSA